MFDFSAEITSPSGWLFQSLCSRFYRTIILYYHLVCSSLFGGFRLSWGVNKLSEVNPKYIIPASAPDIANAIIQVT